MKRNSRILLYWLPLLLLPSLAQAQTPAQAAFSGLYGCLGNTMLGECRQQITAGSVPFYDRFNNYGLTRCLPLDLRYISEERLGEYTLVSARTPSEEGLRLAFAEEDDRMKLDVPESLKLWLGENWQGRVDAAEQLYVLMRQQFGDNINCNTARALIK